MKHHLVIKLREAAGNEPDVTKRSQLSDLVTKFEDALQLPIDDMLRVTRKLRTEWMGITGRDPL